MVPVKHSHPIVTSVGGMVNSFDRFYSQEVSLLTLSNMVLPVESFPPTSLNNNKKHFSLFSPHFIALYSPGPFKVTICRMCFLYELGVFP